MCVYVWWMYVYIYIHIVCTVNVVDKPTNITGGHIPVLTNLLQ